MTEKIDPKNLDEKRISLSIKELIGLGSFLIYLGIAVAGYYYLREQVSATANDLRQISNDVSEIMRNLDLIQFKQTESINKLNEVSIKLNDVDKKIDRIGFDIGVIASKK